MICGMARRPASGGRPSKGNRATLIRRAPVELTEAVRAEAERLDLSYIANILAKAHGFPPVVEQLNPAQPSIPLSA